MDSANNVEIVRFTPGNANTFVLPFAVPVSPQERCPISQLPARILPCMSAMLDFKYMKILAIFSFSYLLVGSAAAANVKRLLPVFAEKVPGKGGSVWQSEVRLYNRSQQAQLIRVERLLPGDGVTCSGFAPITMPAGSLAQIRSLGCPVGAAAAVEIAADETVEIASVITNLGGIPQDPCCLAGFTQNIPVLPTISAYSLSHTVANLQIPVVEFKNIGRHNLIFVNPNDVPLSVTLRYFNDSGASTDLFQNANFTLSPRSYGQLNDVLPQPNVSFTPPVIRGYWRIEASATMPFYFLDSYVDNATNDATTIESN